MPKTIQIRDVGDDTYRGLVRLASEKGVTVPELLRREAERLAARPSMEAWVERTRRRPPSGRSTADTIAALDEHRGPWPDGGG